MTVTNSRLRGYAEAVWAGVQPRPVTEAAPPPTWIQVAVWVGLLIATTSLALINFHSFQLGAYQDDADYVILARSLVYTDHYGLMNVAGGQAPANFPFGYPLVLAGVERIWPGNVDALRSVSLSATLLTISLLFWGWPLLSTRTSRWWGLAVAGLYALSPTVTEQARITMSEPTFTCAALAAWLLAEWGQRQAQRSRRALGIAIGLGVILTLVVFTRTIGLVFVGVIGLRYILTYGRQTWRSLSLIGLSLLIITILVLAVTRVNGADLWSGNARYVSEYVQYVDGTRRSPNQVGRPYGSLILYRTYRHAVRDIRLTVLPVGGGQKERDFYSRLGLLLLNDWVGWVLLLLIVAGFIERLRQEGLTTFWLALVAYYGVITFWDWGGPRLLYPMQFQLYFALLSGVYWLAGQVKRLGWPEQRWQALAVVGAVAALGCISAYKSFVVDESSAHIGDLTERTQWVRANASLTDVIMSEQGGIDYIYSQRPTVPFPPPAISPKDMLAYMVQRQVKYIVVAPALAWQTPYAPAYDASTQALKAVLDQLVQANRLKRVDVSADQWVVTYEVVSY